MIGRFISGLSMVYGRYLQCEAPKIAKLVYKSNNYGFMVLITIVTGLINQLITGGPHIVVI